uniref:Transglycosylase SLT domain-containing protein n=1 Tax=Kalanchoe fedtschenkoi TaxID=63787 RepID=A0A7N0RHF8_KALFE
MAISFKYWNECVEPCDLEDMWNNNEVSTEWLNAGEARGHKVHLSRDPDGQPYLTQVEMRAVAGIVIGRHFDSHIDLDMICAIAELGSDRQPLAARYDKKMKETTVGIMQVLPKNADWLAGDLGYQAYEIQGNHNLLYRPFVNVYFGIAYLKWLSNYESKGRSEEFVVRAYKGGVKRATHKSTLPYWRRYLSVKESFPSRKGNQDAPAVSKLSLLARPELQAAEGGFVYWDSKTSPEDMDDMWNHPNIVKEWIKSGEKRGKVRFSHNEEKRPYLSRQELEAVAEIILFKHFSTRNVKPAVLCALADIVSLRFVNGSGERIGIMGINYPTATWLYKDLGYKAYKVDSAEDLTRPFVSMYFGAAYLAWLSEYEGRERSPEFVVQAYLSGPKNVTYQEAGPLWLKFEEALSNYGHTKKEQGSCSVL